MGYLWCFPNTDVTSRLQMFQGHEPEQLWLDVEEPVSQYAVDRDLLLIDAWQEQIAGIYSGKWFFDQMGWSSKSHWAGRPLWDSNYDGNPNAGSNFRPYGGWTSCQIKQFKGTSDVGSVHQVDLNVTQ